MSGDWKPGTIAMIRDKATADRNEWRAVRDDKGWLGTDPGMGWVSDADVTDVRPLVVLDLDGLDLHVSPKVGNVLRVAGENTFTDNSPQLAAIKDIADQIEAQTKPPRIPEPGPWGVVEAASKNDDQPSFYVRTAKDSGADWADVGNGGIHSWDDLVDPVLVREGVA